MEEMEEKDLLPQEGTADDAQPEEIPSAADETQASEALPQEDEESTVTDFGALVQEVKDGEEDADEAEEIPEEELCVRCGEARREPDSEYCYKCTYEMSHSRVRFFAGLFTFIVFLLSCVAVFFLMMNISVAVPMWEGDLAYKKEDYAAAQSYYDEAIDNASQFNTALSSVFQLDEEQNYSYFSVGSRSVVKLVLLTDKTEGIINAYQILTQYIDPATDSIPAKLQPFMDKYNALAATDEAIYSEISAYVETLDEEEEMDYAKLSAIIDKLEQADKDNPHGYLYTYYRMNAAATTNQSVEEELKQLYDLMERYPDAVWIYKSSGFSALVEAGEYEKLTQLCNLCEQYNPADSVSLYYRAKALMVQGKTEEALAICDKAGEGVFALSLRAELLRMQGDYDKAIAVCEDAIDLDDTDSEPYRQKAIAMLLKGDVEGAQEVMTAAYEDANISVSFVNTYLVTSFMAKDEDAYTDAQSLLDYNGYSLPDDMDLLENGKITVKDIFGKGWGDVK